VSAGTPLPAAFLVLAEAALTPSGIDSDVPRRLREIAARVAPMLTADHLVTRGRSLGDAAAEHHAAQARPAHYDELSDRDRAVAEKWDAMIDAVEVGLVAGYLLARMTGDPVDLR